MTHKPSKEIKNIISALDSVFNGLTLEVLYVNTHKGSAK
jgi:hypothetical protein